jgi:hypothetical protein
METIGNNFYDYEPQTISSCFKRIYDWDFVRIPERQPEIQGSQETKAETKAETKETSDLESLLYHPLPQQKPTLTFDDYCRSQNQEKKEEYPCYPRPPLRLPTRAPVQVQARAPSSEPKFFMPTEMMLRKSGLPTRQHTITRDQLQFAKSLSTMGPKHLIIENPLGPL